MMTGKEALIALANGDEVEYWCETDPSIQKRWTLIKNHNEYKLSYFLEDKPRFEFRLKPRTITINDKELPKPSFTCHSTSNSNIIEIGFNTEQEARDFHLQFRRAWK